MWEDRGCDVSRMRLGEQLVARGVLEEGQLRRAPAGRRLHVRPAHDAAIERPLRDYFDRYATVSFGNYPVRSLRDEPQPLRHQR